MALPAYTYNTLVLHCTYSTWSLESCGTTNHHSIYSLCPVRHELNEAERQEEGREEGSYLPNNDAHLSHQYRRK